MYQLGEITSQKCYCDQNTSSGRNRVAKKEKLSNNYKTFPFSFQSESKNYTFGQSNCIVVYCIFTQYFILSSGEVNYTSCYFIQNNFFYI